MGEAKNRGTRAQRVAQAQGRNSAPVVDDRLVFHPPVMIRLFLQAQSSQIAGMEQAARLLPLEMNRLETGHLFWLIDLCYQQLAALPDQEKHVTYWLSGQLSERERADALVYQDGLIAHEHLLRAVLAETISGASQREPVISSMGDDELARYAQSRAKRKQVDIAAIAARLDSRVAELRAGGLDGAALFQGLADDLAYFHTIMTAPEDQRVALQRRFRNLDYFVRNFWKVSATALPTFG